MLVVLAVVLKLISLHFRFSGFVWYLGVYFNFCTVSKCIYVVWSFLCGLWIWIAFCFFFFVDAGSNQLDGPLDNW